MRLKQYVKKNYHQIRDKYTISQHVIPGRVDPRKIDRNYPLLWEKFSHCRLYIPLGLTTQAGYIDLNKEIIHHVPDKWADPSKQINKLLSVMKYLKDECYVKEPLKFL